MTDHSSPTVLPATPLGLLQGNNPFRTGVATEPWCNTSPDIASINRQAFEDVLNLIKNQSEFPKESLAGAVLGEVGEGKTHLLRRILLACTNSEPPTLFVFVRPWIDAGRPFQPRR